MSTLVELLAQEDTPPPRPERMNVSSDTPVVKTPLDEALLGVEGNDPLPASTLMVAVDRLYQSFNNMMTDFYPAPSIVMPSSQIDIKEIAEFDVKTFREACNELSAEFTKTSAEWQLTSPEEAFEDEAKDLEKAIKRQEDLIKQAEEKLKTESAAFEERMKQ